MEINQKNIIDRLSAPDAEVTPLPPEPAEAAISAMQGLGASTLECLRRAGDVSKAIYDDDMRTQITAGSLRAALEPLAGLLGFAPTTSGSSMSAEEIKGHQGLIAALSLPEDKLPASVVEALAQY